MDKSQVLAEMQAARDEFDALLGQLSAEQMLDATLEGGRSVKDMLSHIAAWERRCARWLADSLRGEVPERPEPGATSCAHKLKRCKRRGTITTGRTWNYLTW